MKPLQHFLEYLVLKAIQLISKALPHKTASNFGAFIGGFIPLRKGSAERVEKYLKIKDGHNIVKKLNINIGRMITEYPHLSHIAKNDVQIVNDHIVSDAIQNKRKILFVSGHTGNWELCPPTIYHRFGLSVSSLYRRPNNHMVAKMLEKERSIGGVINTIPKSVTGARMLISYMKQGRPVGFLYDQKYNEGDPVPFFGKDAMSYTDIIPLCQKYGYIIIPGFIERLDDNHSFALTFYDTIDVIDKTGMPRDKIEVFKEMNLLLERYIKRSPSQWLWTHRRWGKE